MVTRYRMKATYHNRMNLFGWGLTESQTLPMVLAPCALCDSLKILTRTCLVRMVWNPSNKQCFQDDERLASSSGILLLSQNLRNQYHAHC